MQRPVTFAHVTRLIRLTRLVFRIPQAAVLVLLAPVLLVQARRMVRRRPLLDPAAGAEYGWTAGDGPMFRFVVIGESTALGLGAPAHTEALPGFLAEALRERLHRPVAWSVTGKKGATARRISTDLVPLLNGSDPDLVVVTVGVNDLIRRRRLPEWAADLTELVTILRGRYDRAQVLISGMPPLHRFPSIPWPLRPVLGARARGMDRIIGEVAGAQGAVHAPMSEDKARDRRLFASDGFHPSPAGYRAWAYDLADVVAAPASQPVS